MRKKEVVNEKTEGVCGGVLDNQKKEEEEENIAAGLIFENPSKASLLLARIQRFPGKNLQVIVLKCRDPFSD